MTVVRKPAQAVPKIVVWCCAIALATLVTGCQTEETAAPAPGEKRASKTFPAISVIAATRESIVDVIHVSGLIEPVEPVSVAPQVEGQPIELVHVDVGDVVAAGQVLATLSRESLDLQKDQLSASLDVSFAGIAQAKAQIAEARSAQSEATRARARSRSLAKRGVVSRASLDTANAQATAAAARLSAARESLKSARAQLAGIRAQVANVDYRLARTRVTAPVAGVVTARSARIGAIATAAGSPMFELIRDGALELRADVAEQELQRIKVGQPVRIHLTGARKMLPGSVRLVEPTVNRTSRLGRVRIQVNDSSAARAGLFAQASIELARSVSVVLPISAVGTDANGDTALRVEDKRVKRIRIVTGARTSEKVAVLDGLSEGDVVVARAGAFVRDGDRINPVLTVGKSDVDGLKKDRH